MNPFDELIFQMAEKEGIPVPPETSKKVEDTLSQLPQRRVIRFSPLRRIAATAAGLVFVFLFLLPNVSVTYAQTLEQVPVLGKLIQVVTIRNYVYSDDYHDMDIDVPGIEDGTMGAAGEEINKDVEQLIQELTDQFYADVEAIGDEGHTSLYADYDVVTNTDQWFTLKLSVFQASGSGTNYYVYYNVDRSQDQIVQLGDLFTDNSYAEVLRQDILAQMKQRMEEDPSLVYWTENSDMGQDFIELGADHNFYFDDSGNLVIPFDEYEVAPGYMGCPEFTIQRSVFENLLNDSYRDLFA